MAKKRVSKKVSKAKLKKDLAKLNKNYSNYFSYALKLARYDKKMGKRIVTKIGRLSKVLDNINKVVRDEIKGAK